MPRDPELREELLQMAEEDKRARSLAPMGRTSIRDAARQTTTVDRRNTSRMQQIVARRGWPDQGLVGPDGATAAWLLVQHADHDLEFQRLCLALMMQAASRNLVDPANVAYLTDRIRMNEGRPQLYGTQLQERDEKLVPFPIEDEDHVDKRREGVGLPLLAEYEAQAAKVYGPADPTSESL
jgi:hypothetical protein